GGNFSGFVSIGGSVSVNMIATNVNAYISGGTVTADDNITILAAQTGTIDNKGGVLNVGFAAGYGASVVVNTTDNVTLAYINNAAVTAKGNGGTAAGHRWCL